MPLSSTSQVFFSGNALENQPGIQAYTFNEQTGKLIFVAAFSGFLKPSYILPHPNGKWLYAVSETSQEHDGIPGSIIALKIERDPLGLNVINRKQTGGGWPCHLRLDRSGKWLLATNYYSGNAGIWPIMTDGSIGNQTDSLEWQGKGPNLERQDRAHLHSSIFSPDNRFVIIADLGSDLLSIQKFDAIEGKFSPHQKVFTHPGAGPRHMVFHPAGDRLYVSNELDNSVSVYAYDSVVCSLTLLDTLKTIIPSAVENIAADIHLSPDARRLYVSNRGHNNLAVFAVSKEGDLSREGIYNCGGNWPRNFAISPGGRFILVANQYSSDICSLPLNPVTGEIGDPVERIDMPDATCVQFMPGPN